MLMTFQHSPNLFGDCEAYGFWPKRVLSHVAMAFACSFTRVFTFDLVHDSTGSFFLNFVFCFLSMLDEVRMALWETLMLKSRITFATL